MLGRCSTEGFPGFRRVNAVAHEPLVRAAHELGRAVAHVVEPFSFAREHNELTVRGLLLDPRRHADVVWVPVRNDQPPDVRRLIADAVQLLGEPLRSLRRPIAGVEERYAFGPLERVRHDPRQRLAGHGRTQAVESGDDLQGVTSFRRRKDARLSAAPRRG